MIREGDYPGGRTRFYRWLRQGGVALALFGLAIISIGHRAEASGGVIAPATKDGAVIFFTAVIGLAVVYLLARRGP